MLTVREVRIPTAKPLISRATMNMAKLIEAVWRIEPIWGQHRSECQPLVSSLPRGEADRAHAHAHAEGLRG